jgi:chromosome segregation ATPase
VTIVDFLSEEIHHIIVSLETYALVESCNDRVSCSTFMEGLSELEWPTWTSKQSELLIDGLKVTQVLSNVSIQLETLRKRRFATTAGVLFEDELNDLSNRIKDLKVGGGDNAKIPPIEEKVKFIERRVDNLDEKVSDKSDIARLEIKLNGRIEGLEKRIGNLEAQLKLSGNGLDSSFQARIELLESNVENFMIKFPPFENNLESLTDSFENLKKLLETLSKKVVEVSDSCSINQYRLNGLENMITEILTGMDKLKVLMDYLPEECLKKVKKEITFLDEKKADKSDLNRKADLSQLLLKADLSDLSQLNDLCNQLDRRLQENKLELNDGLKGLKNNVDKRLEALLQWILKQLKRLADRDSGRGDTGTDIGKVKCLVCDQVVSQNIEADSPYGAPGLPISLKTLHSHIRPMPFENGIHIYIYI